MSLALHLKYRPQTVAELDQVRVRDFFQKLLNSGQFAQTYLFTGQKGTGKTSSARILAKVVNCDQNTHFFDEKKTQKNLNEPCNTCDSCIAITRGSSAAVIEMDAASNRGIDDIRSLRDQIYTIPSDSRFAVYIIDEVHMLTKEAFNALLKTLEEPPTHAIFCLATTELHKLPATIVSRCTVVKYTRATHDEIAGSLQRVVVGESLDVEAKVLNKVAEKADGSFRDAVNILQSLINGSEKITIALLESMYGASTTEAIEQLYQHLLNADAGKSLEVIKRIEENGEDASYFSKQVIAYGQSKLETTAIHENSIDSDAVLLIEVFSQTFSRFADVPISIIPLEMAVVEFCIKKGTTVSAGSSVSKETVSTVQTPQTQKSKSQDLRDKRQDSSSVITTKDSGSALTALVEDHVAAIPEIVTERVIPRSDSDIRLVLTDVKSKWNAVLTHVGRANHGIVTLLKRGQVSDCEDNRVILKVKYEFHKQQLEQDRYLSVIEKSLTEIFGSQVYLGIQLDSTLSDTAANSPHKNISGEIPKADEGLVTAVEDAFGI